MLVCFCHFGGCFFFEWSESLDFYGQVALESLDAFASANGAFMTTTGLQSQGSLLCVCVCGLSDDQFVLSSLGIINSNPNQTHKYVHIYAAFVTAE